MAKGGLEYVEITEPLPAEFQKIFSEQAIEFVATLARTFEKGRRKLLQVRAETQKKYDAGMMPDFLPETKKIREEKWTVEPVHSDLWDRRVEVIGPTDKKTIIEGLNSGANVFVADLEDSTSPTWENMVQGQINLRDAVRRTISFATAEKAYNLNTKTALLMMCPRGLHLVEKHVLVDGEPISASLFDFGLYFFHNARELLAQGKAAYLSIPKLESYQEARWWDNVIGLAEQKLGIPVGTTKVTVCIETLPAVFQMDEILWELKERAAGLSCDGRDYLASFMKKTRKNPKVLFPDRFHFAIALGFLGTYATRVVQACHTRRTYAIGDVARQIPIRNDLAANTFAMARVTRSKLDETFRGHDGTRIAHPALVPLVKKIFETDLRGAIHQRDVIPEHQFTANDLLQSSIGDITKGEITEEGLRVNVSACLHYLFAWLSGNGCATIDNVIEDFSAVEFSCAQIWQWIHNPMGILSDGRKVTKELVVQIVHEEYKKISDTVRKDGKGSFEIATAVNILEDALMGEEFPEFLTLLAYEYF